MKIEYDKISIHNADFRLRLKYLIDAYNSETDNINLITVAEKVYKSKSKCAGKIDKEKLEDKRLGMVEKCIEHICLKRMSTLSRVLFNSAEDMKKAEREQKANDRYYYRFLYYYTKVLDYTFNVVLDACLYNNPNSRPSLIGLDYVSNAVIAAVEHIAQNKNILNNACSDKILYTREVVNQVSEKLGSANLKQQHKTKLWCIEDCESDAYLKHIAMILVIRSVLKELKEKGNYEKCVMSQAAQKKRRAYYVFRDNKKWEIETLRKNWTFTETLKILLFEEIDYIISSDIINESSVKVYETK